jgi:hypothetical protein
MNSCPNCQIAYTCPCVLRVASNGKQGCIHCIGKIEAQIAAEKQIQQNIKNTNSNQ